MRYDQANQHLHDAHVKRYLLHKRNRKSTARCPSTAKRYAGGMIGNYFAKTFR
jgi:hypothetical protein